jgi:hypothetical protein
VKKIKLALQIDHQQGPNTLQSSSRTWCSNFEDGDSVGEEGNMELNKERDTERYDPTLWSWQICKFFKHKPQCEITCCWTCNLICRILVSYWENWKWTTFSLVSAFSMPRMLGCQLEDPVECKTMNQHYVGLKMIRWNTYNGLQIFWQACTWIIYMVVETLFHSTSSVLLSRHHETDTVPFLKSLS